ncbi:MAG: YjbH domain-containing protein, partial [Bacteroidota bacterium]
LSRQKGVGDAIGYINLGFLPFAEINVRLTRPYGDNSDDQELGIGDRSYNVRFRILKESEKWPAIAIGFHDLFNASSYFNTNYLVLSKQFSWRKLTIGTSLGYGYIFGEPFGAYLDGIFGSASVQWKNVEALLEYDAEYINFGARAYFFEHLQVQIGLMNFKALMGSVGWTFRL